MRPVGLLAGARVRAQVRILVEEVAVLDDGGLGAAGGTHPAVYNAANEVGVDAFHDGAARFTDIVDTIEQVLQRHDDARFDAHTVEGVLAADAWARDEAAGLLASA